MKTNLKGAIFPLLIFVVFALIACGGSASDTSTISISLSTGSAAGKAAVSIDQLTHVITLSGPTGTKTVDVEPGTENVSVTVAAGLWNIRVEAYFDKGLYAVGTATAEVRAGRNTDVTIQMTVVWTEKDNSGSSIGSGTPNPNNPGTVTPPGGASALPITVGSPSHALTPLVDGTYDESNTTFTVAVGGFLDPADASGVGLEINGSSSITGLTVTVGSGSYSSGILNFTVNVECTDFTPFASTPSKDFTITGLTGLSADKYTYTAGTATETTTVDIYDGDAVSRAIPVYQDNIGYFNNYANTAPGLGKHYKLTENIVLSGPNNWTPIGRMVTGEQFTGTFDGNSKTISDLDINITSGSNHGLFGYISGATAKVSNLTLTGVNVNCNALVGGVVGSNFGGTVQNCKVTGNVEGNGDTVGGVVGNNNGGTVQGCQFAGNVTGTDFYAGGIVGLNYGPVKDCHASGTVTVIEATLGEGKYAGGVVGLNTATVENCSAAGDVSGNEEIGGVVGTNSTLSAIVQNCYATGNVSGIDYTGGVVGMNNGTVKFCYYTTGTVNGGPSLSGTGGIVGQNQLMVENCYSTGSVSGELYIGGVAGLNDGTGTVKCCYSTSKVIGTQPSSDCIGGIVGYNSGPVEYCVALNTFITTGGTINISRVVGSDFSSSLSDLYGRDDITMLIGASSVGSGGSPLPPTLVATNDLDGDDVIAADYNGANSDTWWPTTAAFLSSAWSFDTGRLPTLLDMPPGTQNPMVTP